MNRRATLCPLGVTSPASLAAAFLTVIVLALVYNAASAIAQTRPDSEPRVPVQPALPLPDRFTVPPRIVVPSGPRAEIDPPRRIVTQGQRAVFNSRSVADPDTPITAHRWSGPGGQNSSSRQFTVDTTNLKPSTYTVTLVVSDRRQRQGRTTATLVVQARPRPPIARISPDGSQVNQGARVRFSSTSYHPDRSRRIVRTQWQTSWRQRGSGNFIDV
ncbi:MAG: PKD domain-containing protein, partial [Deltaproteobacteria bacterium]|nr:PKD domain-containing protein [Deltaproteobacteria bacterium]